MKRLILAILSFLYLSTAIGANLHFHYCMGELASWGFGYNKDKECGKCGMDKTAAENSGCCKDEFKHIELDLDQKSPNTAVYKFHVTKSEPILSFSISLTDMENRQSYSSFLTPDPPRSSCVATFIRNCNLRI